MIKEILTSLSAERNTGQRCAQLIQFHNLTGSVPEFPTTADFIAVKLERQRILKTAGTADAPSRRMTSGPDFRLFQLSGNRFAVDDSIRGKMQISAVQRNEQILNRIRHKKSLICGYSVHDSLLNITDAQDFSRMPASGFQKKADYCK